MFLQSYVLEVFPDRMNTHGAPEWFSMLSFQPGVLPGWSAMWLAWLFAVKNTLRGDECFNTSESEWTSPPITVICGFSAGSTETGRNPAARMWGVWERHRAAKMSVSARQVNTSILYRALFYWKVLTHFLGKIKALIFVMHVPYSWLKLEPTGGLVLLSMSAGSESKWYVEISNNLCLRLCLQISPEESLVSTSHTWITLWVINWGKTWPPEIPVLHLFAWHVLFRSKTFC